MTIRTRFAPSPTGYLHIGGVRTALFNWLLAKQAGGQFILRIDDTDEKRNQEEALQPILDGFRWLGMDWDEGPEVGGPHEPYFQSQRKDKYNIAVEQLLASGHAYKDYSGKDHQAEREAAEKAKQPFLYSRKWMAETEEQAAAFESEGRTAVVRLKMPREGTCEFHDAVRGDMSFEWSAESDHIIQRSNGTCTYHLANVVDDHEFKITHVVRAEEHLSNTPRQIFIIQSLGYELPEYAHLPFVAEPGSKKKLSKREIAKYLNNKDFKKLSYQSGADIANRIGLETDPATFNPVLVEFYREAGFLPAAILNYLVLRGWSLDGSTEDFTVEEMTEKFSLDRVVKAPASFDPQKLTAFQGRYFNELPAKRKYKLCIPYLQKAGLLPDPPDCDVTLLDKVISAAGDRLVMAGDILKFDDFFLPEGSELEYNEKRGKSDWSNQKGRELLGKCRDMLADTPDYDAASLETAIKSWCEAEGIGIGDIIHALRVGTTGKAAGFAMFDTLEILGREEVTRRIDQTLKKLEH